MNFKKAIDKMSESAKVRVSIFCTAYNQEDYISAALDSFLIQECNFKYEILVHDDASTDNTPAIIRAYQRKYPEIIKPVFQEENQFSKGLTIASNFLLPLAKGDYLAWCEGDDYWLDPYKLQKQFDLMEENKKIGFCAHASVNVDAVSGKVISYTKLYDDSGFVDYRDTLERVQTFATNSFFMRRELYQDYLSSEIYPLPAHGDHKMSLFMGAVSEVYYFSDVMSAYRVAAKGSINRSVNLSKDRKKIEQNLLNNRCELLEKIDGFTNGRFHDAVIRGKKECEYIFLLNTNQYKEIKRNWSDRFSKESLVVKLRVRLIDFCPILFYSLYRLILKIKLN